MPAAKQSDPTSLRSRIKLWLLDHPGTHAAADIAAALGVDNSADCEGCGKARPVTQELGRMVRRGELVKVRPPGAPKMGPGSTYALPPRDA